MSLDDERRFEDRQQRYYTQELNRTLPTRIPRTESSVLELALGNVDPTMPRDTRMAPEIQMLASDFGTQSGALQREATCRAMPYPGPAMRAADARAGCGWWFVPDPTQQSIGAYGTRRGPMDPTLGTRTSGEWIWNPQEAYKRESQKEAVSVKSCKDVENPILIKDRKIGWCNSTGRAIVTDGKGNPAYPQAQGGDCPDNAITMPGQPCPPPPPPTEWQLLTGMGGGEVGVADLCQSQNGVLSPGCLGAISTAVMGSNGVMTQSFRSGYAGSSEAFTEANRYLQERGFTIDQGVIKDGRISVDKALATVKAVKAQADAVDGSRMTAAAANLAYGTPFNPCPSSRSEPGPHDANCIRKAALAMGYSPEGGILPERFGMAYWNKYFKTWGDVLTGLKWWKDVADKGPSFYGGPDDQTNAISHVYGVGVKFPKTGCNSFGILMYRYFFPTWDGALFPAKGPQTHFLGRYILKNGFPAQGSTMQDQTPGGGYLTEGQRMVTDFYPKLGGTYQFLIQCDDFVRLQINGVVIGEVGCCGVPTPTKTIQMNANQPYTMVVDLWNGGGPWSFGISMSINGTTWTSVPADQLRMKKDRRMAMIDLPFNKMPSGTNGPISDTNNVFQNLQISSNSSIGDLNGRKCLLVKGSGSNVNNNARFAQGIRLRAMKSFTCMLQISSINYPAGTTPSIVGFFNLPSTQITAPPKQQVQAQGPPNTYVDLGCWNDRPDRHLKGSNQGRPHTKDTCEAKARALGHKYFSVQDGNECYTGNEQYDRYGRAPGDCPISGGPWKAHTWGLLGQGQTDRPYKYDQRTNDFMITASREQIYPWGINPGISNSSRETRSYPMGQWFHLAFVWDEDFKGYNMYINGVAGKPFKLNTPPYSPELMMEQIRIGCDVHPDGQSWTGGIAWFRAFDYKLNEELIARDMNDDWDSLK